MPAHFDIVRIVAAIIVGIANMKANAAGVTVRGLYASKFPQKPLRCFLSRLILPITPEAARLVFSITTSAERCPWSR